MAENLPSNDHLPSNRGGLPCCTTPFLVAYAGSVHGLDARLAVVRVVGKLVSFVHPGGPSAGSVAAQTPAMIRELGYDKAEWVASQPVNLSELLKVASRAPQYFNLQRVNGSSVQHIAGGTSNWHWDCFVGRLLPAVARIMPEAIGPLYLLVNSYDEPVSRLETTCDARILDAHANIFGWPDRVSADEADRLPVFSPCKCAAVTGIGCIRTERYVMLRE